MICDQIVAMFIRMRENQIQWQLYVILILVKKSIIFCITQPFYLFFYSQVLDGGTQLIRMYRALLMLFGWHV